MRLTELNPVFLGNGGEGVTYVATGLPVPRREVLRFRLIVRAAVVRTFACT